VALADLPDVVAGSDSPPRPVAVTFDDGYADNHQVARPLLERCGIPGTVFVSTGWIGLAREFWWDELSRAVFGATGLEPLLQVSAGTRHHTFELVEEEYGGQRTVDPEDRLDGKPGVVACHTRAALVRSLHGLLRSLGAGERDSVLEAILEWSRTPRLCRDSHRPLLADELSALASSPLIELGAHSVTHVDLRLLDASALRHEIGGSRSRLEAVTGRQVLGFAYPFGSYSGESASFVAAAGFARACRVADRTVGPRTHPLELPRVHVPDCDGDAFARRLAPWFRQHPA
jgi:peptidoglycan/xylan/chitin deacetylase (PgdA/CDA1 family)